MDALKSSAVLASLVSLGLLWFTWHWLFRAYFTDVLRDKLFARRDELVALVATHQLTADDPVYNMLRASINGSIRMAHRISLVHFFLITRLARRPEVRAQMEAHGLAWAAAVARLPEATQRRVNEIRGAVHYDCAEKMVRASMVMTLLIIPVICWQIFYRLGGVLPRMMRYCLGSERVNRLSAEADYMNTVASHA